MGPEVRVASAAYQPEPKTAAAARRFVRETLQAWVTAAADRCGLVDDAVLLTSELVTNAVVHAGTPVQVTCRLAEGAVEVVVSDGHPGRLVPEAPEREAVPSERIGGRGLLLPAALASAWGVAYGRASKAVWFRLALDGVSGEVGAGAGGDDDAASELADAIGVMAALAAALRTPEPLAILPPAPAAADSGYQRLLAGTVESARVAVGADAAFAMMPDEDGDLRLRAAAGTISLADGEPVTGAASMITVPFVVDGQVTGLLAAASAASGRFGDPEWSRLQWLADRSGPGLQRAWLAELERLRRGRIAVLTQARGLLSGDRGRDEILELAGRAVVPGLAPWCAVLLLDAGTALRTYYARHTVDPLASALPWLLDRVCQTTMPDVSAGSGAAPRPGHRWPLVVGDTDGGPAGVAELATGVAWCFPLGEAGDAAGVLVIGDGGQDRLPHDVAALAADLACRIGFALNRAKPDVAGPGHGAPAPTPVHGTQAENGPPGGGHPARDHEFAVVGAWQTGPNQP